MHRQVRESVGFRRMCATRGIAAVVSGPSGGLAKVAPTVNTSLPGSTGPPPCPDGLVGVRGFVPRQRGRCRGAGGGCARRHRLQVSQGQVRGDEGEFGASSVFMGHLPRRQRIRRARGRHLYVGQPCVHARSRARGRRYSWHQDGVSDHNGRPTARPCSPAPARSRRWRRHSDADHDCRRVRASTSTKLRTWRRKDRLALVD